MLAAVNLLSPRCDWPYARGVQDPTCLVNGLPRFSATPFEKQSMRVPPSVGWTMVRDFCELRSQHREEQRVDDQLTAHSVNAH